MTTSSTIQARQCVHFKLSRDLHVGLRQKLFVYNVSMQAAMDEFARAVANDDPAALGIIKAAVRRKRSEHVQQMRAEIDAELGKTDKEEIYDLLEELAEGAGAKKAG